MVSRVGIVFILLIYPAFLVRVNDEVQLVLLYDLVKPHPHVPCGSLGNPAQLGLLTNRRMLKFGLDERMPDSLFGFGSRRSRLDGLFREHMAASFLGTTVTLHLVSGDLVPVKVLLIQGVGAVLVHDGTANRADRSSFGVAGRLQVLRLLVEDAPEHLVLQKERDPVDIGIEAVSVYAFGEIAVDPPQNRCV